MLYSYFYNLKIKSLKIKSASIVLLLICIAISVVLLLILHWSNKLDLVNGIGIVGSIASLTGIIIAYIQIVSVKKITESTNLAINKTLNELLKSFSISDLSRAIKLVQEVQNFIRLEKIESALLRMQDLKSILIQIRHVEVLNDKYENEEYREIMTNLNIDISNINMILIKQKNGINNVKLCENLELVSTFFSELESKLKYSTHE